MFFQINIRVKIHSELKFGRWNLSLESKFLTDFEKNSSAIFDFYRPYKESIKEFPDMFFFWFSYDLKTALLLQNSTCQVINRRLSIFPVWNNTLKKSHFKIIIIAV